MKCGRVRKHLSAYLDGELDLSVRRQVDQHLESCPACAAELSKTKEVAAMTVQSLRKTVGAKSPPIGLQGRTVAAMEKIHPKWPRLIPVRQFALAAVVVALVTGFLVGAAMESRFRAERRDLEAALISQKKTLAAVRAGADMARTQMLRTEARLSRMENRLQAAMTLRASQTGSAQQARQEATWPPIVSSLQIPPAEDLLQSRTFRLERFLSQTY